MDGTFFDKLRDRIAFILAVALTTAWVIVVGVYMTRLGWQGLMGLPVGDLAALLTAAAGPPVALWLLMTVLEQRREMRELRRRMGDLAAHTKQSVQQAETHVRAVSELQSHMKRLMAAETHKLILHDLAAQTALLGERLGVIKGDMVDVLWARYGSGNVNAFVQPFLQLAGEHPEMGQRLGEAMARDPAARAALASAVQGYARLVAAFADDRAARVLIEDGPLGQAARIFNQADQAASATAASDPADQESDALRDRLQNLAERLDANAPQA